MEIVIGFIAIGIFIIFPIIVIAVLANLRRSHASLRDELYSLQRGVSAVETRLNALERAERAVPPVAAAQPSKPVEPVPTPVQVAEPVVAAVPVKPKEQAVVHPPALPAAYTQKPAAAPPYVSPYVLPSFTTLAAQAPKTEEEKQSASERAFSLEEALGKNWLNKLGVGLLVIGIAFFLAYKLPTMSALGKILTGFGTSAVLLLGGLWIERKKSYRIFAAAGIGGGWALAYFTTFAMYHLNASRVIQSLAVDLVLMLIVAAGMVAHSLRYKSQTVTSLAFLLAFATLLTSHLESQIVFSLAASAVLAIALVIITVRKHWVRLELAGLLAVYITHFVWLTRVMPDHDTHHFTEFWPSTILILMYWLIFRLAYLLDKIDVPERHLSAILNAAGVLGLLKYQSAHPEWAWWALAALGVIEFAFGWSMRKTRRTGFAILTTIGILLLVAAVPFKFHGFSWPILWLVEAQVLAVAGLRLGEPLFRRLGLFAGFATGIVLAGWDVFPLIYFRLDQPDASHHWQLTIALALAAILYWVHAEVYPRRWPVLNESSALGVYLGLAEWEQYAAPVTSFLALGAAATALWVALPDRWVAVAWMGLALVLGLVARKLQSVLLSYESDAAALIAILALNGWVLPRGGDWLHTSISAIVIVLLYGCSFRNFTNKEFEKYFAGTYTWAAAVVLIIASNNLLHNWKLIPHGASWQVPITLGFAVIFFELALWSKRKDFLWQGLTIGIVASLVATGYLMPKEMHDPITKISLFELLNVQCLPQVLVSIVLLFWIAERAFHSTQLSTAPRVVAYLHSVFALVFIAAWPLGLTEGEYIQYSSIENLWLWISVYWALLALLVMAFSALIRRPVIHLAAVVLAGFAVGRVFAVDIIYAPPAGMTNGVLFRGGVVAVLLLLGLPFAYRIRKQISESKSEFAMSSPVLTYPHQWLFFLAFVMEVAVLAAELKSAHVTIAWAALGVAGFLFALLVGERSFRLSGLALLLLSVLKIILMDVWQLNPSDRYVTLIILGLALIGVSFLYTRFSAQIRKLL